MEELRSRLAQLPPRFPSESSEEEDGWRPADDPVAIALHEKVFDLAIKLGKAEHAERSQYLIEDEDKQAKWDYAALLDDCKLYEREVAELA